MASLQLLLSAFLVTGLASTAQAFTKPSSNTWGPLLKPDLQNPVTQGQSFTVTWDPETRSTEGVTVSLVLCHGNSANCVLSDTAIASGIPANQKSFDWQCPCDLAPGEQQTDSGYGMLVIVDGTGEFQYSTQFSVLENPSCSAAPSSTPASNATEATTTSFSSKFQSAFSTITASYNSAYNSTAVWTNASATAVTSTTFASVALSTTASSGPSATTTSTGGTSATSARASVETSINAAGKIGTSAAGIGLAAIVAMLAL